MNRSLFKSKEDFDVFIVSALKQHEKEFDGGSDNEWQDIYNQDIASIKPPTEYPAMIYWDSCESNYSCWNKLNYHYVTKKDLGL